MQSFMDTAGPPPLSPSSLFTFDGESMMSNGGSGNGQDDGVDLFRYYLDLQAFQSKDNYTYNNGGNGNNLTLDGDSSSTNNNSLLSLYNSNAFFNPNAYPSSSSIARPSPSSPSTSSLSSISQPSHQQQPGTHEEASRSIVMAQQDDDLQSAGNTLYPFAEASFSGGNDTSSSLPYNNVNPSSLLSFDHLAGSENPQPIDPHLLMGSNNTSVPTSSILLPTVKEEEVEDAHVPLSNAATATSIPLMGATMPSHTSAATIASTSTSIPKTRQHAQQRRSTSTVSHNDDSMNGIDGLSEGDDSENDSEEEEEEVAPTSRKRGSAGTASSGPAAKKRTSATKSSSSNKKASSSSSKKETSIFSSQQHQQHPHALVPVPEYEDRLSKEEYDKLSSKEKRQMRNKISARNFRHRRKAHIDTLEALVSDKDRVIRVLSEEVGTLRTENQGLRADIEVLKKNWESIAAKIGAAATATATTASPATPAHGHSHLTPDEDDLYGAPGSLPALSPAASSSAESTNGDHLSEVSFEQARTQAQTQASQARPSTSASTSSKGSNGRVTRSSIQRPNLRKDLGPSGASFSAFGTGRTMNVHTTLIPELNFNFPVPPPSMFSSSPPTTTASSTDANNGASNNASSGRTSPASTGSGYASIADMLAGKRERDANASLNVNSRLNMNPALNGLTPEQIANLREQFFNANSTMLPPSSSAQEENATSLVSGKVSRGGNNHGLDPLQNSFFDTNPFISLRQDSLQDYRAQLYAKLANNVAGIHQAQSSSNHNSNSNKNSDGLNGLRPAFFAASPPAINEKDAEVAKIASIAQKTLFDKLSTAFWDAFAGNNTSSTRSMVPATSSDAKRPSARRGSSSSNGDVDGQKVADLLAGRSRMQIVSNVNNNNQEKEDKVDSLARQVENMALKK
ncbi:hypothetical protein P389DRAFT_207419 [Cystobasidium minutum MCA 4210]|uniref:uncharacterized protein n=1 Tax=Cystobasidium minutum MCA 4210 TaxID=1397322 RepID=UPI0034CD116D|eukprot:jgi/Rhomi1/207419/estExt_Genemark1.C_1_t10316